MGERFGMIQVKVGFISFLRGNKYKLAPNQSDVINYDSSSLILKNLGGINLTLERDVLY